MPITALEPVIQDGAFCVGYILLYEEEKLMWPSDVEYYDEYDRGGVLIDKSFECSGRKFAVATVGRSLGFEHVFDLTPFVDPAYATQIGVCRYRNIAGVKHLEEAPGSVSHVIAFVRGENYPRDDGSERVCREILPVPPREENLLLLDPTKSSVMFL